MLVERARTELALLGEPTPTNTPASDLDTDGRMAKALGLLQRHRRTGAGAGAAAREIRQLEALGALTPARVEQLFTSQQELLGHEIGPLGYLLAADDALSHEQFVTAVGKYRQFFAELGVERGRLFEAHLERFAAAACYAS